MEASMDDDTTTTLESEAFTATRLVLTTARAVQGEAPSERYGHSAVRVGRRMLVFGGCDAGGRFLDDLLSFNLDTNTWEAVARPSDESTAVWPKGRHFHGAVVVDDRFMYVLFGKSNGYHSDVHRFDTMLGAWERIEAPAVGVETPSKRYGHSVVQWRGDLYVFGGFDDFGLRCNDLWRYEWKRNSWSLIANLQSIEAPAAMHHCAVVLDGSMYVWGGQECTNELFEYRFGSKSWSKVNLVRPQHAPRAKWGHKAFIWEKELWVLGGNDAILSHNGVWIFNFEQCEWRFEGEAANWTARNFFSLVEHDSSVILFGGRNNFNYLFNDIATLPLQHSLRFLDPSSTYHSDFSALLAEAASSPNACRFRMARDHIVCAHRAICYARVPALRRCNEDADFCSVEARVMEALLAFVYLGELNRNLETCNVQALVHLGKRVEFTALVNACQVELISRLTREEACSMLAFVVALKEQGHRVPLLTQALVRLLVSEFRAVKKELKAFPNVYYEVKALATKGE